MVEEEDVNQGPEVEDEVAAELLGVRADGEEGNHILDIMDEDHNSDENNDGEGLAKADDNDLEAVNEGIQT